MARNSTYSKIQEIVTVAARGRNTVAQLAAKLQQREEAFIYYARQDGDILVQPCQLPTITRQIRFCMELGLLDEETCELTSLGRSAHSPQLFDMALQQAVLQYLEENGAPWEDIEATIMVLDYPSPRMLYVALEPTMDESVFRTCLFLLSQCGRDEEENVLAPRIFKVYLTDRKAEAWPQI
jgi:hypothetical protein